MDHTNILVNSDNIKLQFVTWYFIRNWINTNTKDKHFVLVFYIIRKMNFLKFKITNEVVSELLKDMVPKMSDSIFSMYVQIYTYIVFYNTFNNIQNTHFYCIFLKNTIIYI